MSCFWWWCFYHSNRNSMTAFEWKIVHKTEWELGRWFNEQRVCRANMRTWGQIPSIHVKSCQLCVTVIPVLLQDGRHPEKSLQAHRPTILVQAKANNKRPHLKHCGRRGLPTKAIYWLPHKQHKCMPVHTIMNVCLMVHSHNIALLPSDVLPMLWVYRIFCIIF